jgi:hypothetical protein
LREEYLKLYEKYNLLNEKINGKIKDKETKNNFYNNSHDNSHNNKFYDTFYDTFYNGIILFVLFMLFTLIILEKEAIKFNEKKYFKIFLVGIAFVICAKILKIF